MPNPSWALGCATAAAITLLVAVLTMAWRRRK
ncbi:MYXO-CTERM sorting domain-containing protein [Glutamicibacter ardleyensis]